jgi:hypothetical protein
MRGEPAIELGPNLVADLEASDIGAEAVPELLDQSQSLLGAELQSSSFGVGHERTLATSRSSVLGGRAPLSLASHPRPREPASMPKPATERPPRCGSPREQALLSRMCQRAGAEFTEWECARLLTEFKRNLSDAQWVALQKLDVQSHEDALQALIVYGFENRRLKRLHLRGRGRDRVWAEAEQQARLTVLMRRRKG